MKVITTPAGTADPSLVQFSTVVLRLQEILYGSGTPQTIQLTEESRRYLKDHIARLISWGLDTEAGEAALEKLPTWLVERIKEFLLGISEAVEDCVEAESKDLLRDNDGKAIVGDDTRELLDLALDELRGYTGTIRQLCSDRSELKAQIAEVARKVEREYEERQRTKEARKSTDVDTRDVRMRKKREHSEVD